MPRLPRFCPAGIPQHTIQRGHNKQVCFCCNADFATYINFLKDAAQRCHVSVHAWVLMTNHVHLLVTPEYNMALSRMMQILDRNYACYFNATYQRTGTIWEGRFKSCLVQSGDYLLECYRYIELNPVRANIVKDPAQYNWSSYRINALGTTTNLVSPHPEYLSLGSTVEERLENYRSLCEERIGQQFLAEIRKATNKNMALGNSRFKTKIEKTYSRRIQPAKPPGRPANLMSN